MGGSPRATVIATVSNWSSHSWGQEKEFPEIQSSLDYKLKDINQLESKPVTFSATLTTCHCFCTSFLVFITLCKKHLNSGLTKVSNICLCPTNSPATFFHLWCKCFQGFRVVGSGYRMNVVHSHGISILCKVFKYFLYFYIKENTHMRVQC